MYRHSKTTRPSHSRKNAPHRRIAAEHLRHNNVCSRGTLLPRYCRVHVTLQAKTGTACLQADGTESGAGVFLGGGLFVA